MNNPKEKSELTQNSEDIPWYRMLNTRTKEPGLDRHLQINWNLKLKIEGTKELVRHLQAK